MLTLESPPPFFWLQGGHKINVLSPQYEYAKTRPDDKVKSIFAGLPAIKFKKLVGIQGSGKWFTINFGQIEGNDVRPYCD